MTDSTPVPCQPCIIAGRIICAPDAVERSVNDDRLADEVLARLQRSVSARHEGVEGPVDDHVGNQVRERGRQVGLRVGLGEAATAASAVFQHDVLGYEIRVG